VFGQRQDIQVEIFPDVRTALFALVAGQADALIYPQSTILSLARRAGIDNRIEVVGPALKEVKRGIGVTKSDGALLEILSREVENSSGPQLIRKSTQNGLAR
jgi:ABC-type amino acid transport substrate-binding protein